nr:transposase [Caldalkalibacillus salinus]
MSSSINNSEIKNQLEKVLKSLVQEKLELIMKEELENYLKVERPELANSKNGFYNRSLDTRYGKIEDLSIPRDRQGEFQTQLFAPYQRRDGWLEEAIIKMYQSGMSTREVGKFIERILGSSYSATTISKQINSKMQPIYKKKRKHWRESCSHLASLLYVHVFCFE